MLCGLADMLQEYVRALAVFQYLTTRALFGVITALVLSLLFGPWMIRRLNYLQIGQAVRTDGPQTHLTKSGTPTMGGTLILASLFISTLLWSDLSNSYVWVVLLVTGAFVAVDWLDDYLKVVPRHPRRLSSR